MGRLLNSLKDPDRNGDKSDSIANDTLILFTSDNGGTHFDNLPLRGVKGMFTEGGIRIPLIAYWPGVVPENSITDRMVHGIDFYPTLLELAETPGFLLPKKHPLDGESFAKFLLNPQSQGKRSPIFYLFPGYMDVRAQPCVVTIGEIDSKRYKLLYFYEADEWELYNLTEDIGEKTNLAKDMPGSLYRPIKENSGLAFSKTSDLAAKIPISKKGSTQPSRGSSDLLQITR